MTDPGSSGHRLVAAVDYRRISSTEDSLAIQGIDSIDKLDDILSESINTVSGPEDCYSIEFVSHGVNDSEFSGINSASHKPEPISSTVIIPADHDRTSDTGDNINTDTVDNTNSGSVNYNDADHDSGYVVNQLDLIDPNTIIDPDLNVGDADNSNHAIDRLEISDRI